MARLLTDIPALVFPVGLDRLVLASEDQHETSCRLRIGVGPATVFETTLWFDTTGQVTVEDLAPLVCDQLRDMDFRAVPLELEVTAATGGSYVIDDRLLLPCRVAPAEDAAAFCRNRFLTLCDVKQTTAADTEHFALYDPPGDTLTTAAVLRLTLLDTATGRITTEERSIALPESRPDAAAVGFSLRLRDLVPEEEGLQLVSVEVTAGRRHKTLLMAEAPCGSVAVELRNAFGCRETVRLARAERETKPARQAAFMGGRYRNYLVREETTWKGTTLPVADGELPLIDDLVHAPRLWRAADGAELAVTDSEWKYSTEAGEMPRATVTWRESGRVSVFTPEQTAGNIFDSTFDETYD